MAKGFSVWQEGTKFMASYNIMMKKVDRIALLLIVLSDREVVFTRDRFG